MGVATEVEKAEEAMVAEKVAAAMAEAMAVAATVEATVEATTAAAAAASAPSFRSRCSRSRDRTVCRESHQGAGHLRCGRRR